MWAIPCLRAHSARSHPVAKKPPPPLPTKPPTYPKKPPPLKVAAKKGAESLEVYNTLEQCKIDDEKADGTFVKKRSNWKQLWVSDEDEKEQEKK